MSSPERDLALERLFEKLASTPWDFDFFALLRQVEALHPEWPRFGEALRPSHEGLRLGQDAELDFAPAALSSFARGNGPAPRVGVRFFGLLGSQGPMPLHITEYVRERQRFHSDPTAGRFLDLFHHRLLALFYRAWSQSQPAVQRDRPREDRFKVWLGSAFGLSPSDRLQGRLPEEARLFQAGLLGSRSRHPEGLTKLLSQYFQVPVRVECFVAHRMSLEPEDLSRLGHARNRHERSTVSPAVLGKTCTAGRRLAGRQHKFRIQLGPLDWRNYQRFLPGGPAFAELRDWVRQYTGLDMIWDLRLGLRAAEQPEARLGRGVPLGVAAWLGRKRRDRADLHLRPETSFLLEHRGARHAHAQDLS